MNDGIPVEHEGVTFFIVNAKGRFRCYKEEAGKDRVEIKNWQEIPKAALFKMWEVVHTLPKETALCPLDASGPSRSFRPVDPDRCSTCINGT